MLIHEAIYIGSGVLLFIALVPMSILITRKIVKTAFNSHIFYKFIKYRNQWQGRPHFVCTQAGITEDPELVKYHMYRGYVLTCVECEMHINHPNFKSVHVYMDAEQFIESKLTN